MKNILLVDDEPDVLSSLGALLRRNGYHVWAADTGGEDLEVASELLAYKDTHDIPIIFLTNMMRKEGQAADGPVVPKRCVIAKPCRTEEILGIVRRRIGTAA